MSAEQLEFPSAADICELVFGDVTHVRERDAVVAAIRADADAHDGHVDPNRVRLLIPSWVGPRVVSATYSALRSRGVLARAEWTKSDDARGRNVGKPQRTYRWVGETS